MRKKKPKDPTRQNLVAKHCKKYNKATVERDRTKYNRKQKHNKKLLCFFMSLINIIVLQSK